MEMELLTKIVGGTIVLLAPVAMYIAVYIISKY